MSSITMCEFCIEAVVAYGHIFMFGIIWCMSAAIALITVAGLIRCGYHYATGKKIGDAGESSLLWRAIDLQVAELTNTRPTLEYESRDETGKYIRIYPPYGFHIGGLALDLILAAFLIMVFFATWPLLLIVGITFFPLYYLRQRALRKQEFLNALKGEQDAT